MKTNELSYFKESLEGRKAQILKNISGEHDELLELRSCELNDEGDHASVSNSAILKGVIAQKQEQELQNIHKALTKIREGQYGVCAMCGADIGAPRLKVKPHAIYCIDCRETIDKEK